jgi:HSP20 family protein
VFGQFRRDVRLPGDFTLDKAEATYEAGLLKLSLPKAEHLKPKSLRVTVTK